MSPSAKEEDIVLRPIGLVTSPDRASPQEIEIRPEFARGLDGVQRHDHLWVLFWMHRLDEQARKTLEAHPKGDVTLPKAGVFSLHSPWRPNPIGMARVRLVEQRGNRLVVEGLDALQGSPVLDIKSG
jgi:tRNA-Thr(GGU) m(6)t(6)A37 methyltransferase TsaA